MNFDKTVPILLIICGVFGPVTARHQRGIRVERALTFTDDSATGVISNPSPHVDSLFNLFIL